MKIIRKDNYDRETVPDKLIAENVDEFMGKIIVDLLNDRGGFTSDFFMLVADDYKLYEFKP